MHEIVDYEQIKNSISSHFNLSGAALHLKKLFD